MQMNECVNMQIHSTVMKTQNDGWMDGCMDVWMDGGMDGWTDRRMDGWMNGQQTQNEHTVWWQFKANTKRQRKQIRVNTDRSNVSSAKQVYGFSDHLGKSVFVYAMCHNWEESL